MTNHDMYSIHIKALLGDLYAETGKKEMSNAKVNI
jgi:hypothetical protein